MVLLVKLFLVYPGWLIAQISYLFPARGQIIASARRKDNIAVHVFFSLIFWAGLVFLMMEYPDFFSKLKLEFGRLVNSYTTQRATSVKDNAVRSHDSSPKPVDDKASSKSGTDLHDYTSLGQKPRLAVGNYFTMRTSNTNDKQSEYTTERTIVGIDSNSFRVASKNTNSGFTRTLEFTHEWNLISSRDPNGQGSNFVPPLKYYDFPLFLGKEWTQTSTEKRTNSNQSRIHRLFAKVVGVEEVIVSAGKFQTIKIVTQTELFDPETGRTTYGNDTSWYSAEVGRSVKTVMTSREEDGKDKNKQTSELISYNSQKK